MKKLLAVMLAAMMLLAMVACGNNNSEPTPEPTPPPDETKTLYMATEGAPSLPMNITMAISWSVLMWKWPVPLPKAGHEAGGR